MYSLKYGTVPIVRKTGGLADTVFDWDEMKSFGSRDGNGFSFVHYDGFGLYDAVQRALEYFSNKNIWKLLQRNGMKQDFSWDSSAKKYLSIYKQAARK
jgi:starch synthase